LTDASCSGTIPLPPLIRDRSSVTWRCIWGYTIVETSQIHDWHKEYTESFNSEVARLAREQSHSLFDHCYLDGVLKAKLFSRTDGFLPYPDANGKPAFTQQQARMAACHTREDASAILIIQRGILRRLTFLCVIGAVSFIVLVQIAVRLGISWL
jgi:hypothetical protein